MRPPVDHLIRPMTPADVDLAADVVLSGGWGDRRSFFRWATGRSACRPIVAVEGGAILGTGVATINGSVGWVGTIFVAEAARGRGLGAALTRAVVGELERSGCTTLVLVATDLGRPIYERLGFAVAGSYVTHEADGGLDGPLDPAIRAFGPADVAAATELDRWATGEDRGHIIESFAGAASGWTLREFGELRGFLLRSPWGGAATIAPDPSVAVRILDHRRRAAEAGHGLRAGILDTNVAGARALEAAGWRASWSGVRMERGPALDWHPDAIWGQFGFAFG